MITVRTTARMWVRLGLILALLAPTASAAAAERQHADLTPITLQLKWRHQFQAAGFYAAIAQGYYRDAGFDVTLRELQPGEDPVDVVRSGTADYGVGASDLLIARANGAPVVALAAIYQHSPQILLARRDAGIETVHDLPGKSVMMEPQLGAILAYLRDQDVPVWRLNRVPHALDPGALIDGRVDAMTAYSTDEPFLLRQAGVDYRTLAPRTGGVDFYGDTLFATEDEIARYPERVAAFRAASLRGWRYALEHPEEIVALIREQYSQRHTQAHLMFEARRSRPLIAPNLVEVGYMNPKRWRRIAQVYASHGLMGGWIDLDAFLWQPSASERPWWSRPPFLAALFVILAISLVTVRFYNLNQTLQAARNALHEEERRCRLLVEATPFPVAITRLEDGRLRFLNPAANRRFELDPDRVSAHTAAEFYEDPAERAAFAARLRNDGHVERFEARMRSAQGATFWAELTGTRFTYEGEPCAFVAITDITPRKALETNLQRLADTDSLTGLWNRRKFFDLLADEQSRIRRYGRLGSVIMLDLDHFKSVNDDYGHAAGDAVLTHVTSLLCDSLRATDVVARVGGEEFLALLPETDEAAALQAAEKLRTAITAAPVVLETGETIAVTASFGVTAIEPATTPDDVVSQADRELYRAKERGRNRVEPATRSLSKRG